MRSAAALGGGSGAPQVSIGDVPMVLRGGPLPICRFPFII